MYPNSTNPQTIFARVQNIQNKDCYDTTSFGIGVFKMPTANKPQDMYECDGDSNDGKASFNLTLQNSDIYALQNTADYKISYHLSPTEANLGTNPIATNYESQQDFQTIYARIENVLGGSCFSVTDFNLHVEEKPILIMEDSYSICEGKTLKIDAPLGFSSYLWSTGATGASATFNTSGSYSLTVTKNYPFVGCTTTKNITVYNSNIAKIASIETSDWTEKSNSIKVFVTGDGIYEYSIDGINYQDSPEFYDVQSGQHTIYVNDKRKCGIATKDVFLLVYPKFFTPNGDGVNDQWKIRFSLLEPGMHLCVYDRHGKVISCGRGRDFSWDGTLNGQTLPATDYWFVVTRQNGMIYKGHFALKR